MTAPHSIQPPKPTQSTFNVQADGVEAITNALRSLHLSTTHENATKPETRKTKPPPMSCMNTIKITPPHSTQPPGQVQWGLNFQNDDIAAIVASLQTDAMNVHVMKPETCRAKRQARKSRSQQTTAAASETAQQPTTSSRLLALPRELRDIIYDYAVKELDIIQVTEQLEPPALTRVNHQVRFEALRRWWSQNCFKVTVKDCDVRLLRRFECMRDDARWDLNLRQRQTKGFWACFTGIPHWKNLVEWCRTVYRGGLSGFARSEPTTDAWWLVIQTANAIAADGRSWAEVERNLKAYRPVAGALDRRWLLDHGMKRRYED